MPGSIGDETEENDEKGWANPYANLSCTNFYSYPSSTQISNDAFTESWSKSVDIQYKGSYVLTGDVYGDNGLEIISCDSSGLLRAFTGSGETLWQKQLYVDADWSNQADPMLLCLLADISGDSKKEIFIGGRDTSNSPTIWVIDGNGVLLKSITHSGAYDSGLYARDVDDYDSDGDMDIFVTFDAGYGLQPRGAGLIDYGSGTEIWHYEIGPRCLAYASYPLSDVDNDGMKEMILSTFSPHNGHSGSGSGDDTTTNDGEKYTIVIDENGDEEFTVQGFAGDTDGRMNHCVADVNDDGVKEIIAFDLRYSVYEGYNHIYLRNPIDGAILHTYTGPYDDTFTNWAVADIDNSPGKEIVVTNTDGRIRILDETLTLVDYADGYSDSMNGISINDLNGDGSLEIIFSDNNIVRVMDNELNELWNYPLSGEIFNLIISDVTGDGINEIIIAADELYVLSYDEESAEPAKKALLIGCWDYSDWRSESKPYPCYKKEECSPTDLRAPPNDIENICVLLKEGFNFDITNEYILENPSKTAVEQAFNNVKNFDDNIIKFIYYSGHGYRGPIGNDIEREGLNLPLKNQIFYDQEMSIGMINGMRNTTCLFQCCNSSGLCKDTDNTIDNKYTNEKYGIMGQGKVIGMASLSDEGAYESGDEEGPWTSDFTRYFIKAFTSHRWIVNNWPFSIGNDPRISVEEAFNYAKLRVEWHLIAMKSHPQIYDAFPTDTSSDAEQFYLSDEEMTETLSFVGMCPIHLHLYDGEGNHLGLNEQDPDEIDYEISNGIYLCSAGDDEETIIVFNPNQDDDLELVVDAYDAGFFTLECKNYDDETQETETIVYSNIPITSKTNASLSVTQGVFSDLFVDEDADGVTDSVVEPIVYEEPVFSPTARFIYDPSIPQPNQEIAFDASVSFDLDGEIVEYNWEFGDGSVDTGIAVSHMFESIGTYDVVLTVTDDTGLSAKVLNQVIVSSSTAGVPLLSTVGVTLLFVILALIALVEIKRKN